MPKRVPQKVDLTEPDLHRLYEINSSYKEPTKKKPGLHKRSKKCWNRKQDTLSKTPIRPNERIYRNYLLCLRALQGRTIKELAEEFSTSAHSVRTTIKQYNPPLKGTGYKGKQKLRERAFLQWKNTMEKRMNAWREKYGREVKEPTQAQEICSKWVSGVSLEDLVEEYQLLPEEVLSSIQSYYKNVNRETTDERDATIGNFTFYALKYLSTRKILEVDPELSDVVLRLTEVIDKYSSENTKSHKVNATIEAVDLFLKILKACSHIRLENKGRLTLEK